MKSRRTGRVCYWVLLHLETGKRVFIETCDRDGGHTAVIALDKARPFFEQGVTLKEVGVRCAEKWESTQCSYQANKK